MIQTVILSNDFIGGYYLEVYAENMTPIKTFGTVEEYAYYVQEFRDQIEGTLWTAQKHLDQEYILHAEKECKRFADIFMLV